MNDAIQYVSNNWETIVLALGVICTALSQIFAIFGKPKIVAKIAVISKLLDTLAGNYGKSKNKAE